MTRKSFDRALTKQQTSGQRKVELTMERKLKITQEEYIDAIYSFGTYKSPCCLDTIEKANDQCNKFNSELAKLVAVKEKI